MFGNYSNSLGAASSHSIGEDVSQVSSDLESNSTLSNFSSFSTEHKEQDQMGIAFFSWVEKLYTSESKILAQLDASINDTRIEALAGELTTGESSVAVGGTVEGALGAETVDAAAAAGFVDSGGLVLIPLAGLLAYQDITTGTNVVYDTFFSSQEDHEKTESVAAESLRWREFHFSGEPIVVYKGPGGEGHPSGAGNCVTSTPLFQCQASYEINHSKCSGTGVKYTPGQDWEWATIIVCGGGKHWENPAGEEVQLGGLQPYGYFDEAHYGNTPSSPFYMLQLKAEGKWFDGSMEGCQDVDKLHCGAVTGSGVTTKNTALSGWNPVNKLSGCEGAGPTWKGIAGYPSTIGPSIYHTEVQTLRGKACEAEGTYADVQTIRAPSRMHIGFPRPTTKSAMEKLASEGHHVEHWKGESLKSGQAPNAFKKLDERMKEHGQRRLEQGVCHWMECEKQPYSAEPETHYEPEIQGKTEGSPPALPGTSVVPSCTFMEISGAACVETLKEHGFTKTKIEELGWEHAVVTKPPLTTIRTSPSEGSEVETSTEITVVENPSTEHFPVPVPPIGYGHETASEYKARLESEGWTKISISVLSDIATDPNIGPNQASYTVPAAGTETAPGRATSITVEANPSDASTPSEGGGIGAPTLPGFKIPNFGVLCKGFPFGVPCWLINTIQSWSATSVCPKWSFGEFTVHGKKIPETTINLCTYGLEPLMEKVRIAMLIFSTLGLVLLFYRFAKGGSPPSGGGMSDYSHLGEADEGVYL